jgi:osmotically-inducible protein OsmY
MNMIHKSDKQLHEDVLWKLQSDSRFSGAEVEVKVDAGIVTLTGNVDSFAKQVTAQEVAHLVHGVLDVANDIHVKIPNAFILSDTEIALAVRNTIKWDVWVPENIQSTVTDGWVTLEGTVEFFRERNDAGNAIRNLRGVRGVYNNLLVHLSTPPKKEADIKAWIEKALQSRAEHEMDRIEVEVHDGSVVLAGKVHSWYEKQAVLGAVSYAPGVTEVRDNLYIS